MTRSSEDRLSSHWNSCFRSWTTMAPQDDIMIIWIDFCAWNLTSHYSPSRTVSIKRPCLAKMSIVALFILVFRKNHASSLSWFDNGKFLEIQFSGKILVNLSKDTLGGNCARGVHYGQIIYLRNSGIPNSCRKSIRIRSSERHVPSRRMN